MDPDPDPDPQIKRPRKGGQGVTAPAACDTERFSWDKKKSSPKPKVENSKNTCAAHATEYLHDHAALVAMINGLGSVH